MTRRARSGRAIAGYYLAVGVALVAAGAISTSWWTLLVGIVLVGFGVTAAFNRAEGTSWLRGELDERRDRAVDHGFRVAFITLAWWVAVLTAIGEHRSVANEVWSAGILVAFVAALVDYAVVLRRS